MAVAEERNFTRAAEKLHLAQQAVSKTVRRLEEELGVSLLERTTREVRLTKAGEALLGEGAAVLAAADAAFDRARRAGRGLTGRLRLGVSPAVGDGVVRAAVEALQDDADDLSVVIVQVPPRETAAALRERSAEVVLARTLRRADDIASAQVAPTPAVLAVPDTDELSTRDEIDPKALSGRSLLVWSEPGTPYTDLLVSALNEAGADITPVESRIVGGSSLAELARKHCVALVPAGWPPSPGVRLIPLVPPMTLPLLVAWRAGPIPPAVDRLRAALGSPA